MTTGGIDKLFDSLETAALYGEFSITRNLWKKDVKFLESNGLVVKFIAPTMRKGEGLYLICWDNGEVPMENYDERDDSLKAVNRLWAMAYKYHKEKKFKK